MLIKYAHTEPQHPDGRQVLSIFRAAKNVRLISSKQRSADYSFLSKHKQSLGVEYKTARGFYQDVLDERLYFQLGMLAQDYDIPVVCIVGSIQEARDGTTLVEGKRRNYPWASIQRHLTRMQWTGVTTMFFSTPKQAANYILRLCRSLDNNPLEPFKERPPQVRVLPMGDQDAQAGVLAAFPGIGDGTARKLLDIDGHLRGALEIILNGRLAEIPRMGKATVDKVERFLEE